MSIAESAQFAPQGHTMTQQQWGLGALEEGVESLNLNAEVACNLLKSMAHEGRLVILCLLSMREYSVMELEECLELRQPAVSQQLARLRSDNLVSTRREGKLVYYSLASEEARAVVRVLVNFFGKS